MTAYLLTAFCVAMVVFVLISRTTTKRFNTHDWPTWARFTVAWIIGFFWPVLSLWSIGYVLRELALICWRWILGEHNKPQPLKPRGGVSFVGTPTVTPAGSPGDKLVLDGAEDGVRKVTGYGDLRPGERLIIRYDAHGTPTYELRDAHRDAR